MQAPRHVWIDAQLPPAMAHWIATAAGCDCSHVMKLGLLASSDDEIFTAARQVGAVVVTKDEDFVGLLERLGPPPQVVWLTCGNVRNTELRRIVEETWPKVWELLMAEEPLVEVGRLKR